MLNHWLFKPLTLTALTCLADSSELEALARLVREYYKKVDKGSTEVTCGFLHEIFPRLMRDGYRCYRKPPRL
jgi:hypothetical protein